MSVCVNFLIAHLYLWYGIRIYTSYAIETSTVDTYASEISHITIVRSFEQSVYCILCAMWFVRVYGDNVDIFMYIFQFYFSPIYSFEYNIQLRMIFVCWFAYKCNHFFLSLILNMVWSNMACLHVLRLSNVSS